MCPLRTSPLLLKDCDLPGLGFCPDGPPGVSPTAEVGPSHAVALERELRK
jgi:hypothetical protein